jgi:hypothetical protein
MGAYDRGGQVADEARQEEAADRSYAEYKAAVAAGVVFTPDPDARDHNQDRRPGANG